jgi:DNA-binding ferritin-like protein
MKLELLKKDRQRLREDLDAQAEVSKQLRQELAKSEKARDLLTNSLIENKKQLREERNRVVEAEDNLKKLYDQNDSTIDSNFQKNQKEIEKSRAIQDIQSLIHRYRQNSKSSK